MNLSVMFLRHLKLLLLMVLSAYPGVSALAAGQKSFSGRVLDDYTGQPVDAATVDLTLYDFFGPILLDGVVTGPDGAFSVSTDSDGALSIRILREGYSNNSTFYLGNFDSPATVTPSVTIVVRSSDTSPEGARGAKP